MAHEILPLLKPLPSWNKFWSGPCSTAKRPRTTMFEFWSDWVRVPSMRAAGRRCFTSWLAASRPQSREQLNPRPERHFLPGQKTNCSRWLSRSIADWNHRPVHCDAWTGNLIRTKARQRTAPMNATHQNHYRRNRITSFAGADGTEPKPRRKIRLVAWRSDSAYVGFSSVPNVRPKGRCFASRLRTGGSILSPSLWD